MAWNGSESKSAAAEPRKTVKPPPSKWRGLVALVVVAVGGLAAWLVMRPAADDDSSGEAARPSRIAEVKPHISTNKAEEAVVEKKEPERPIMRISKVTNPISGETVVVTQRMPKIPANALYAGADIGGRRPKKLYSTFAENYIVGLMRTKPGFTVVGTRLPANFDEQFKARIADPVGYADDDTEEDRAIRERMVAFKRAAAEMIADGKTPTEIVLEERREMNRIADMRNCYLREIGQMRKNGASQEEIDLTVEAANKILGQNGGTHIKFAKPFAINKEEKERNINE